ncbi:hypothetical protein [Acetobacter pomorum]|uniref:hypothetical protein n=1 Tax=Acetobacter pomorum TaxID=65959 RepID=UPI001F0772F9|nr:hypothetical protein [Acetobacter pomorum]
MAAESRSGARKHAALAVLAWRGRNAPVSGGNLRRWHGATRGVSYPQPLADAEILRWCHMRRLNEAETDFTFQLVKSLDQTFLQIRNQQIQQDLAHTFRKR